MLSAVLRQRPAAGPTDDGYERSNSRRKPSTTASGFSKHSLASKCSTILIPCSRKRQDDISEALVVLSVALEIHRERKENQCSDDIGSSA
jgi:hypothetical protein